MKSVKKVDYVLKKALRKKGEVGDIVKVTRGFGRYLETQGIAQRINDEILQDLEKKKALWKATQKEEESNAETLIDMVKKIDSLVIKKRVAQGEKLYDSVRAENIVQAFKEKGINLSLQNIKMNHQIKKIGKHPIIIHAYGNFETEIQLEVISDIEVI